MLLLLLSAAAADDDDDSTKHAEHIKVGWLWSNNAPIFPREAFQREGAHINSIKKTQNRIKRNIELLFVSKVVS